MRKFLALLQIILTVFLCCCFCACNVNLQPFKPQLSQAVSARVFRVYVFGCVEKEGYVEVEEGADYLTLVQQAGILPQTVLPTLPWTVITQSTTQLAVQFFDGANECSCVNVNLPNAFWADANISESIAEKISYHISTYGKITNKAQLKVILGDDYADNFYKFYVSESDFVDGTYS